MWREWKSMRLALTRKGTMGIFHLCTLFWTPQSQVCLIFQGCFLKWGLLGGCVGWKKERMEIVGHALSLVKKTSFFMSCLMYIYYSLITDKGALKLDLKFLFWVMVQPTVCGISDTHNIDSSRCSGELGKFLEMEQAGKLEGKNTSREIFDEDVVGYVSREWKEPSNSGYWEWETVRDNEKWWIY